jgi:hypothetical protein
MEKNVISGDSSSSSSSSSSFESNDNLSISPRIRDAIRRISRRALLGSEHIRAHITDELTSPERTLPRERIAFVLGVAALLVTQHVLLVYPRSFGFYYTCLAIPLLIYRVRQYIRRKWGSFLLDFCYLVNILLLVHLWVLPFNPYFFEMVFAAANGPVAWAIILWRNSLVFHSPERLTSLFIHLFPPLVTYCQRWLVYNSSSSLYYASTSSSSSSTSNLPLLPSYLSCVDPVAAKNARELLLASYKAAVEAAADATANSLANISITMSEESLSTHTQEGVSVSSPSSSSSLSLLQIIMQIFGFSVTSAESPCPVIHVPVQSSPPSPLGDASIDASDAIASAETALGAVSGNDVIEIPFFGEIPISEFEKNVYPEDIAGSLFTTCDHSYWRVLGVPLICYLLWQISYFILTEMPLPISFMRRFCKVEVDHDEDDENDHNDDEKNIDEIANVQSDVDGDGKRSNSTSGNESSDSSILSSSDSSSDVTENACRRRSRMRDSDRRGANSNRHVPKSRSSRSLFSDPTQLSSLRWMVNKARTGGLTQGSLKFARFIGILKKHEEFDSESKRTKFVFALIQLMITIAGLACSKIMYDNQIIHTLFLIMLILVAAYNGASFTLRSVDIAAAEKGQPPPVSSLSEETKASNKSVATTASVTTSHSADIGGSGGGKERDKRQERTPTKFETADESSDNTSTTSTRSPSELLKKASTPALVPSSPGLVSTTTTTTINNSSSTLTPSLHDAHEVSRLQDTSSTALLNSSFVSVGCDGSENRSGVNLTLSDLTRIEEKERGRSSEVQSTIRMAQVYTSASEARQRVIEESKNWVWLERRRFFVNRRTGEQSKVFPSGVDKRFISIDRERA